MDVRGPLLGILLVHELGHYLAARRYEIDTTPPYFIPIPPTLSPIGSLGAFIKLKSAVLDRRQLLDVGRGGTDRRIRGRARGAALGIPDSKGTRGPGEMRSWVAFAGQPIGSGRFPAHPLAARGGPFPMRGCVHLSLPAFAGWVGAFITGLNLLPLSQLDGGHVLYGILGRHQRLVAGAGVLALLALAQYSPSWYLWV